MTCIDRAAKTVEIDFFLEECCTKLRDKDERVRERYQALI